MSEVKLERRVSGAGAKEMRDFAEELRKTRAEVEKEMAMLNSASEGSGRHVIDSALWRAAKHGDADVRRYAWELIDYFRFLDTAERDPLDVLIDMLLLR